MNNVQKAILGAIIIFTSGFYIAFNLMDWVTRTRLKVRTRDARSIVYIGNKTFATYSAIRRTTAR